MGLARDVCLRLMSKKSVKTDVGYFYRSQTSIQAIGIKTLPSPHGPSFYFNHMRDMYRRVYESEAREDEI